MTRAKWFKRGVIAVGALACLRLLLAVGAHPVAGMVASNRGLDLSWDSHALSLLQGSLELRGLRCGGESTPPFLVAERIHVDLGLRDLASGRLVVEDLDVDGLRLAAGVDADGRLRLGGGYDPARLAGEERSPAARVDADAGSPSLLVPAVLPLELRRARVRHAKLAWRDEGAGGESETLEFEVEADRLFAPGVAGAAVVRASAPRLLDLVRVEARTNVEDGGGGQQAGRTGIELEAQLAGLRAARLATHLRHFGLVARGERIDGALAASLELVGANEPVGGDHPPRTTASLVVRQATIAGDGVEAAGLSSAQVRVDHRPGSLRLDAARLEGPRARLVVESDGLPSFAGLGFDASRVQPAAATPASPRAPATTSGLEMQAAGFELVGGRVEVVDARSTPSRRHVLEDGELRLEVSPSDAAGLWAAKLVAGARLPGVARLVEARAEGSLGQSATFSVEAKAEQVDLSSLAHLLAPLGLLPTGRPADLTAKATLSARREAEGWVASGRLEDLSARDGVHALAAGSATLVGLSLGDEGPVLESLAWRDVEVDVRRSSDGALRLPLVAWAGEAAGPQATIPATGAATTGSVAPAATATDAPASLRIGKLELGARRLRFVDEAVQPATTWELVEAAFALDELRAGGSGAQGARWSASARAPGLWASASAEGTLEVSPAWRVRLDARLRAADLRPSHGQAYLTALGLQALPGAATVQAALEADAVLEGAQLRLSTKLSDARWTTDGVELAACRLARVEGLVARPEGVSIERLEVDAARLALRRDAQGAFEALQLRFDPRAAPPSAPTPPTKPPAGSPFAELLRAPPSLPTLPAFDLKRADLRQLTLDLSSDDPMRPFAGSLVVSGEVLDFGTRAPAAPRARFECSLPPAWSKASIELSARVEADRHELVDAKFALEGLDLRSLSPWLPAGVVGEARAVSARGRVAGSVDWQPAFSAELRASEVEVVDLAQEDAPRALARLERARLALSEWSSARLAIDAVEVGGAELDLARDARGGLHALGFVVGGDALAPVVADARASATPAPPEPNAWRWRLDGLPQVELRRLDLGVRRVAWRDAALGGEPLELGVQVLQSEPWIALSPRDGGATPWIVEARGALAPLVGAWSARLRLAAMQAEPSISASFEASAFDPSGLARVAPSLDGVVDLAPLARAEFATGFEAKLSFPRRDERDFDWTNGVAAEFDLRPTALRSAPATEDGRVLLGVDGVEVDVRRWSPRTGDLHIPRLVVRTPRASLARAGARVQVGGAWLDLARLGAIAADARDPAADPAAGSASDGLLADSSSVAARAPASAPELRIDELSVEGLDLWLRDEGVDPPTVAPLSGLDLSVRRFTTRMLREPRSVRFTMDLGAEEVPMPRRVGSHGLLAGVAKAVEGKLAGRQENLTIEPRKLLEEASLSGRLQLVPETRLTLRAGASAVELLGLRGNAREAGVDVGDGLLDVELRARLVGEEFDLDATATLTDLALSEPKSGPIETYFALPMPLDAVLFLLKDSEDQIRVPVALSASTRGVGVGAIAAAAGRAVVAVVGRAVASAPLRVLKAFIDLDAESKGAPRDERALVAFAPGVATLEPAALEGLEPLLARLRSDPALRVVVQHRLSADDVRRLEQLANPAPADVLALQERLRSRRAELRARHERLAADARAGQGAWRAERVAELRAAWRGVVEELGAVEGALDELGELQRPGADRHRANRTRAAALHLGQRRLSELVELLEAARPGGDVACEVRAANLQVAEDETGGAVLVVLRRR